MCISFEATNLRNTKGNIQITNSKFQINFKCQITISKSQITPKEKNSKFQKFFWNLEFDKFYLFVIYFLKSNESELMQKRCPVSVGPSLKT